MPASALIEPSPPAAPQREAYEALAPWYDVLTAGYEYDAWLSALEALAAEHGLTGRRVLDVGCGTGKSFLPLLRRGYEVAACDLSPAMVAAARRKLGASDAAELFVADMRDLPPAGPVDLVTCLDDAVNHLLSDADLRAALRSFRRVLRPGGLAIFDCNSLATYRSAFAGDHELDHDRLVIRIRGEGSAGLAPGERCAATIEVLARGPRGNLSLVSSSHQRQRHHPRAAIAAACEAAGLELADVRGQLPGGRIQRTADELHHTKIVYVIRRPEGREE